MDYLEDRYVVLFVELLLVAVCLAALLPSLKTRWRKGRGSGASATVIRGNQSMGVIHMMFGASVYVIAALLTETRVFAEHMALVLLVDLALLVYLFYFNSWYRNKLIGLYENMRTEA